MNDKGFIEDMERIGAPPSYLGPKDFKTALEEEYKSALKFAEKLGLRK
jgi:tripartite-type tricarboxylate transporter receptor subunit TctC